VSPDLESTRDRFVVADRGLLPDAYLDGLRPDGARRVAEVWGTRVDEIRYQRALP